MTTYRPTWSHAAVFDRSAGEVRIASYHHRQNQQQEVRIKIPAPLPSLSASENELLAATSVRGLFRGNTQGFKLYRPGCFSDAAIYQKIIYAIEDRKTTQILHQGDLEHKLDIPAEVIAVTDGQIYLGTAIGEIYQWTDGKSTLLRKLDITEPRSLHILQNGIFAMHGKHAGAPMIHITNTSCGDLCPATGGTALAYARDSQDILLFATCGNEVSLSTFDGKISHLDSVDIKAPVANIAFDSVDNYLYALSPAQLTIYPISKKRMLTDFKYESIIGKSFAQVKVMRQ